MADLIPYHRYSYERKRNSSINLYEIAKCFVFLLFIAAALNVQADTALPKGLMLNLDFQDTENGLIPNKSLYPLYVPTGDLQIEQVGFQKALILSSDQGLSIPHSSLIEPDGSEWIASVRVYALSDGLLLSQGDDEHGYAIYLKDGAAHAILRTTNSAIDLSESPETGITDCKKKWVTIELRIKDEIAYLTLNRKRVAMVLLQSPLQGECMRIRLGNHTKLPAVMEHLPDAQPSGFTGAITSLKIWRQ